MVSRVLHHPAELLRPEVRHRVVYLVAAEHVGRDHLGRVQGHVPVLEPQPPAEAPRLERGAVAHRIDTGQGRPQAGVDGHAVLQPDTRALQPAGGRADPDRGDDLVRRDPPAAGQGEAAGLHGLHRHSGLQPHARGRVPAGGLRAHRGAQGRGERRGPGFDHRDLATVGGRRGGQLGADPAGPDDGQPESGPEQGPQGQGIVVVAQEPLPPGAGQRHRHGPGSQDQPVIGVLVTIGGQGLRVHPGGGFAGPEIHVQRAEVGLQRRVDAVVGQHLLRQRRPVVRRPRFRPDQGDLAGEATRAQLGDGAEPGQARARYHDPATIGHSASGYAGRRDLVITDATCAKQP